MSRGKLVKIVHTPIIIASWRRPTSDATHGSATHQGALPGVFVPRRALLVRSRPAPSANHVATDDIDMYYKHEFAHRRDLRDQRNEQRSMEDNTDPHYLTEYSHRSPSTQESTRPLLQGTSTLASALARVIATPLLCGISLGLTYGNIGGIEVADAFKERYDDPSDSVLQTLAASVQIGCVVGSIFAGWVADALGRRRSLVGAALLLVISSAVTCIPLVGQSGSLGPIFLGRALTGLAGGVLCTVLPLHVSECAMAEWRGGVEASFQLAIEFGILIAYLVNYLTYGSDWGWKLSLASPLLPAVGLLLQTSLTVPESPRFLTAHGHLDDARHVLLLLRTSQHDVASELDAISADIDNTAHMGAGGVWKELISSEHRKKVLVSITVLMLQVRHRGGLQGQGSGRLHVREQHSLVG